MLCSSSTDNRQHGNDHDHDLDDLGDPYLRVSRASTTRLGPAVQDDDDDPYLPDEEDPMSRNNAQSIPFDTPHYLWWRF